MHKVKNETEGKMNASVNEELKRFKASMDNLTPDAIRKNNNMLDAADFLRTCSPEVVRRARRIFYEASIDFVEYNTEDGLLEEDDKLALKMIYEMINNV